MVVLTALLFPVGLLASAQVDNPKAFTAWMLLLEAAMIGVFTARDLLLFFVFFEFVLVPMYFLIAGWGHGNTSYAAMKFFLYTMAGSAFLFVGILTVAYLQPTPRVRGRSTSACSRSGRRPRVTSRRPPPICCSSASRSASR